MEILKTNNFIKDINPPVFIPRLTETLFRRKTCGKGDLDPIGKQGNKHPADDLAGQIERNFIGDWRTHRG